MSARQRKCPKPDKTLFDTLDEALEFLRRGDITSWKQPVRAYRCKGHYHVTSKP